MRQEQSGDMPAADAPIRYRAAGFGGGTLGDMMRGAEKRLLARMMRSLGDPPVQVALWDGQEVSGGATPAMARVLIRDRAALLGLISDPELRFGELYTAGRIEVQGDLVLFLETVYRAMSAASAASASPNRLAGLFQRRRNNVPEARRNIHHHYDIGNDFYKLWLDSRMVYTCAYFQDQAQSLEEAQVGKMDYICRKLRLQPGDTVVEAGCGWGALALHMARHYGARVTAYNISKEQIAYARERARAEGLDDRVQFVEDDYRNIRGRFDAFVSVGMLEHVGPENYPQLGATMDRCLAPGGRGLIHSIGRDRPGPMNAWIERHIFPGACPPSLSQMTHLFEPFGFSVLDVENLRLHYARTLEHWLQRYESAADRVEKMFDAAFVRAWRLYLAGSIAAFTTGSLQLFQVTFTRGGNNAIPWTRRYLYE
ncbi:MAG: cyclopropane-fatty-acyl-phospholipid synthase family protein [Pseudomonadota bacterium]|jgi:cyclopropane-fatty-acyl-phospholipid synthase